MKYEFKILYSPIKWISCLILVILIPLVMYVPTYFDFVNVSSIYMPFVGIVLFSDINLLYKESHTEEIMYLTNKKPIKFFCRTIFDYSGTSHYFCYCRKYHLSDNTAISRRSVC